MLMAPVASAQPAVAQEVKLNEVLEACFMRRNTWQ
jgi:hypothetical protein